MPFPKDSDLAVLWAHVNEAPPRLDAYPTLTPVLQRALAKRPDDRYPACTALVDAARPRCPSQNPRAHDAATTGSSRWPHSSSQPDSRPARARARRRDEPAEGRSDRPRQHARAHRPEHEQDRCRDRTSGDVRRNGLVGTFDVATGGETVWVYSWGDQTVRAVDREDEQQIVQVAAIGGFASRDRERDRRRRGRGLGPEQPRTASGVLTRAARRDRFLPGLSGSATTRSPSRSEPAPSGWRPRVRPRTWYSRSTRGRGRCSRTVKVGGSDIASIAVGDGAVWVLQGDRISRLDPAHGEDHPPCQPPCLPGSAGRRRRRSRLDHDAARERRERSRASRPQNARVRRGRS